MKRTLAAISLILCVNIALTAADPTHTSYSWDDCQGSAKPYPVPARAFEYPDSLQPVMINHVGRHGARYPASPKHAGAILEALRDAKTRGTITKTGQQLMEVAETVIELSAGRWGALDSLGMAEQRGIASRMLANYPMLFSEGSVQAISSYAPRCIMSMYEFTHQLARLDNKVEINTASGRRFSPLMRFFDGNEEYRSLVKSDEMTAPYKEYRRQSLSDVPLRRVLGEAYPLPEDFYDLALAEYSLLAGCAAMELIVDVAPFLTADEYNALWRVFNLRQYLAHSASTVSALPAQIAAPLLENIINSTDEFIAGTSKATVSLRFGHAETLMPLLSLMHLRGCYYLTNYFDTVALHWKDFDIVPMAANLQIILFRSSSGRYYVRTDLNEVPVPLIPNDNSLYLPWEKARNYLQRCLPLDY